MNNNFESNPAASMSWQRDEHQMRSKPASLPEPALADMKLLKRLATALDSACRTLSPDCREASRLQSESTDHALSTPKRAGLLLHILLCRWCRRYGKQIRFLRQTVREQHDKWNEVPRKALSHEARERLKKSLHDRPK